MAIKLYNTMTRKKEVFKPLEKGVVRMYTCGPTVYDYPHIGNWFAFTFYDIVKRWLQYRGFKVMHIMNLTDVDDKTIKRSQEEGVPLRNVTDRYTKAFFDDMKVLNILPAGRFPRATEHIPEMVALVKALLKKGVAYRGDDGSIYFGVAKFRNYGKLSKIPLKNLKAGASGRISADTYGGENAADFALWKAWKPEDGPVFWETEIGKGRPGWHIECSAMSMKYLGQTLDVHCGGSDLMFPHHENEIAQSEAATGKPFVRYWLHNAFILVEGQKMSKSLGNFYTPAELYEKGHGPRALRYLYVSNHYRAPMNFTFKALEAAKKTVDGLIDFADRLLEIKSAASWNESLHSAVVKAKLSFEEHMDDDLDMPQALAAMHELVRATNRAIEDDTASEKNLKEIYDTMTAFDKVLGILAHEKAEVPAEIKELIAKREAARKKKDFKTADAIRKQIAAAGWIVEDTSTGPRARKN